MCKHATYLGLEYRTNVSIDERFKDFVAILIDLELCAFAKVTAFGMFKQNNLSKLSDVQKALLIEACGELMAEAHLQQSFAR